MLVIVPNVPLVAPPTAPVNVAVPVFDPKVKWLPADAELFNVFEKVIVSAEVVKVLVTVDPNSYCT